MGYKVCVLRAPGTNCDKETAHSIKSLGMNTEVVHLKRFLLGKTRFKEFDGLVIPGGFSYGDHVRAGALLGKILKERFSEDLSDFYKDNKPILGICNGFQALVECGLLPGRKACGALTTNLSSKFECRWIYLKIEKSNCVFTKDIFGVLSLPVAHGEGRFLLDSTDLKTLKKREGIVLRYAKKDGRLAERKYPLNPNSSTNDIAGVCNESGTIFGLMPHPERAFYTYTHPRETKKDGGEFGHGYPFFKNMVEYIKR